MKKSYFALLRRLLRDEPVPAPRPTMPPMRVIRLGAVLSEGTGR